MEKDDFHLIGIGGIGMSALARLLLAQKYLVTGSDSFTSEVVKKLTHEGAHVYASHKAENVKSSNTTVVFSTAINKDNPEMKQAKQLGCDIWHRSDLLAHLMQSYQSIAVTGTHGKTSTSALLSHTLIIAKQSPSFVIGGLINPQNTNGQVGSGNYFVAEADESDLSFLKYFPNYAIVTNVETDHLDHYKDFNEIESCFKQFISQVQNSLLWCYDCKNLRKINPVGLSYGYHKDADIVISNAGQKGFKCLFDLSIAGVLYPEIELSMIGEHNMLNAAAVFGLCIKLGIDEQSIRKAFNSFLGVKRRAEKIGEHQEIQIYDDYAHHPTEVSCMLASFRKAFPKRRIIALLQPHRYSRLIPFQKEFASSLTEATEVWLTDVFRAGEPINESFSMAGFSHEIEKNSLVAASYVPKDELLNHFKKHIRPFDVLITIGAGDITHFGRAALNEIKANSPRLKLGLLCGSISHEHYVSIVSSRFFISSYSRDLYDLTIFKILINGQWVRCNEDQEEISRANAIDVAACDAVLLALHGRCGEDGMIQGFLQTLNVPYSGANYALSSFNMNKVWMKMLVESLGIKTPKGCFFQQDIWLQDRESCIKEIKAKFQFPLVVKPARMGSTIGVYFVNDLQELYDFVDRVFEFDDQVIVEEKVIGRELEISCLDTEDGLVFAHPGEVKSDVRHYDYVAKYSKSPIEKVVVAQLSQVVCKKSQELAQKIYQAMQIKSYARIDFFLTDNDELIFAEVNTLPGMTPRSLFQRTLISQGLSPKELIDQIVIDALFKNYKEQKKSHQIKQFLESIKDVTH